MLKRRFFFAKTLQEDKAMPFDGGSFDGKGSLYRFAYTIDPNEAEKAWDVLQSNEWAIEFANLPKLMHQALLKTLKERRLGALGK